MHGSLQGRTGSFAKWSNISSTTDMAVSVVRAPPGGNTNTLWCVQRYSENRRKCSDHLQEIKTCYDRRDNTVS